VYLRKQGIELTQPTISRYLAHLKAVKDADTGFWSLEKASAYERNFSELERLLDNTRDVLPNFSVDLKIAVLKTKPHFNSLIAKKINDTFVDEVVEVFCPNDTSIIIVYRALLNSPIFETALAGLCEKFAPQK
jgi:arginine repressor